MTQYAGFVAKINTKSGNGKRGEWTLYTVKIEKAEGGEYADWINFGFDAPPFKEGDYVTFEAESDDAGVVRFTKKTLRLPKNPPQRAAKAGKGRPQAGGQDQRAPAGAGRFDKQPTHPEDAKRIGLSAARTAALEFAGLLIAKDALPLTKAGTKAGEAARFEEITAVIDKLTVRFYHDVATGRLLDSVSDIGEVKKPEPQNVPDRDAEAEAEPEGGEEAEDDDAPVY